MAKKYDEFGSRMKGYENVFRHYLPKRMPVIVRIDGKAFHTYTKDLVKPFDENLAKAFWETSIELCKNVAGCKLAYTQSDEITLLLTNNDKLTTQAYFDNNLQKIVSVIASEATAAFNDAIRKYYPNRKSAKFDCRAFVVPNDEVANALLWRQEDATKNSIAMVAQAYFTEKELHGLKGNQMQDLLMLKKEINWSKLPVWQKRGVCIVRKPVQKPVSYNDKEFIVSKEEWQVDHETPIFSRDREYIEQYIYPKPKEEK